MDALLAIDRLRVRRRRPRWRAAAWREICFWRAALGLLWIRLLVLVALLGVGTVLFIVFEPERRHSPVKAAYYTWSLVFGEPPEDLPRSPALQALFFIAPVIGLVVIIEGIVELALMVRDRQRNERAWCRIMARSMQNHIVLVGVGRLGYRTFQLLRKLGEDVAVIEIDPTNQFLESVRRDGSPLFVGDARIDANLHDANVRDAKCIILATTDDLANLEVALDARHYNPGIRVVLRMFDQNMADKIREGFGIHLAVSQSALSAPSFAVKAIEPDIISSMIIGDELVVTRRWTVAAADGIHGSTVASFMKRFGCTIVERGAGASAQLFPPPETPLRSGDRLLVQGTYERVLELCRTVDAEHPAGAAPTRA